MTKTPIFMIALLLSVFLAACGGAEISTPSETPAPSSTPLSTPTNSATLLPTSTPLPSETSPATETPLPELTPTATPPTFVRENTPLPVPDEPITAENAGQIVELARLGKGAIQEVQLSPNRVFLLVRTTIGVYGYVADRLEEAWRFEDPTGIAAMAVPRLERWIAVAMNDGRIALLIYQRGSMFTQWVTDYREIKDLAFSYDGKLLAAIGNQGVTIWQVGKTKPLVEYPELVGNGVRFTPDGESLIVADESSLTFYKLDSPSAPNKKQINLLGHPTISDDGMYITDGLSMWDGETGELLYQLKNGATGYAGVVDVAFSMQKSLVAVRDLFMPHFYIYDLDDGELLYKFESPRATAFSTGSRKLAAPHKNNPIKFMTTPSMAFSPRGDFLAVSVTDVVEIWNIQQGKYYQSVERDGTYMVYRKESRLNLWDYDVVEQLDPQSGYKYHLDAAFLPNNLDEGEYGLYFSADSQKLFVGDVVWELANLQREQDFYGQVVIGASPTEEKFFTYVGDSKSILSIRNTDTLEELEEIILPPPEAFSEDEPYIFSRPVLSMSGEFLIDVLPLAEGLYPIWYLNENTVGEYYTLGADQTFSFGAFSADGSVLVLITANGDLFIFSMKPKLELIASLMGDWHSVFVSGDGQYLVGFNGSSEFWLYRINQGASDAMILEKIIELENVVNPSFASFSPDNQVLAYLEKNKLAIIDLESGLELFRRKVSLSGFELNALAFSPDGKYLATSSSDGTVKLWGVPLD